MAWVRNRKKQPETTPVKQLPKPEKLSVSWPSTGIYSGGIRNQAMQAYNTDAFQVSMREQMQHIFVEAGGEVINGDFYVEESNAVYFRPPQAVEHVHAVPRTSLFEGLDFADLERRLLGLPEADQRMRLLPPHVGDTVIIGSSPVDDVYRSIVGYATRGPETPAVVLDSLPAMIPEEGHAVSPWTLPRQTDQERRVEARRQARAQRPSTASVTLSNRNVALSMNPETNELTVTIEYEGCRFHHELQCPGGQNRD